MDKSGKSWPRPLRTEYTTTVDYVDPVSTYDRGPPVPDPVVPARTNGRRPGHVSAHHPTSQPASRRRQSPPHPRRGQRGATPSISPPFSPSSQIPSLAPAHAPTVSTPLSPPKSVRAARLVPSPPGPPLALPPSRSLPAPQTLASPRSRLEPHSSTIRSPALFPFSANSV